MNYDNIYKVLTLDKTSMLVLWSLNRSLDHHPCVERSDDHEFVF